MSLRSLPYAPLRELCDPEESRRAAGHAAGSEPCAQGRAAPEFLTGDFGLRGPERSRSSGARLPSSPEAGRPAAARPRNRALSCRPAPISSFLRLNCARIWGRYLGDRPRAHNSILAVRPPIVGELYDRESGNQRLRPHRAERAPRHHRIGPDRYRGGGDQRSRPGRDQRAPAALRTRSTAASPPPSPPPRRPSTWAAARWM